MQMNPQRCTAMFEFPMWVCGRDVVNGCVLADDVLLPVDQLSVVRAAWASGANHARSRHGARHCP